MFGASASTRRGAPAPGRSKTRAWAALRAGPHFRGALGSADGPVFLEGTEVTEQEVDRLLGLLGTTPTQVAQTLENKGCKGTHLSDSCPVAWFLRGAGIVDVDVDGSYVRWGYDADAKELQTPEPVRQFIRHFDGGYFPQLVES